MRRTCAEMTEMATDHMEGRLPMATNALIQLHLMICEHCATYYKQLEQVRAAAASAAADPRPENIDALTSRFREWHAKQGSGCEGAAHPDLDLG